jgi:hypothetical protein
MKRRVLGKTMPFQTLFTYKKKRRSKNGAVLNGTICHPFPLDAQRTGEEDFFLSSVSHRLPLSIKPQKDADPTGGLPPPAGTPVYAALSPDWTEAGHFHRPSLPINTEAEKRHKDDEKKREGQDNGGDTREKNRRERAEKRRERIREWEDRTKKNKEEKTREEEKESRGEKREGPPPRAIAISPPVPAPPQATASATAGHHKRQRTSSSTLGNLLLLFCPCFGCSFSFACRT